MDFFGCKTMAILRVNKPPTVNQQPLVTEISQNGLSECICHYVYIECIQSPTHFFGNTIPKKTQGRLRDVP